MEKIQNMIVVIKKEIFLTAKNTSDMLSDNLNFASSEKGWFFWNGKTYFFPEGKIFPFWKCGMDW